MSRATKEYVAVTRNQHVVWTRAPRLGAGRTLARAWPKVGRNQLCPCGSGAKYKRCHGQTG
jgi:uncharacterized protein YecA (UPF0149 family)